MWCIIDMLHAHSIWWIQWSQFEVFILMSGSCSLFIIRNTDQNTQNGPFWNRRRCGWSACRPFVSLKMTQRKTDFWKIVKKNREARFIDQVSLPKRAAGLWAKRGSDGDRKQGGRRKAASWHHSALCAAARPYANVTYANYAPSAAVRS